MSGTFVIRPNTSWMPTGWIFRAVVQDLIDELGSELPQFTERFREAIEEMPYASIEDATEEEFLRVVAALESAMTGALRAGAAPLDNDARAFFALALHYAVLLAMLRFDGRGQLPSGEGVLVTSSGSEWHAPRWAYDLLVPCLIAWPHEGSSPSESEALITGLLATPGRTDLSSLPREARRLLVEPANWIAGRYGPEGIGVGIAHPIN